MDLLNDELYKPLEDFFNMQSDLTESLAQAYQKTIAPILEYDSLIEEAKSVFQSFDGALSINGSLVQAFQDAMSSSAERLDSLQILQETVWKDQSSLSEVTDAICRGNSISAIINNSMLDFPYMKEDPSSEDFVIIDEHALHETKIPDQFVIPLGNHRIKISTSLFVTFLGIVASIIITICMTFAGNQHLNAEIQKQNQILLYEYQALIEENQVLYDMLDSVDTSESSLTDLINSWKESVINDENN